MKEKQEDEQSTPEEEKAVQYEPANMPPHWTEEWLWLGGYFMQVLTCILPTFFIAAFLENGWVSLFGAAVWSIMLFYLCGYHHTYPGQRKVDSANIRFVGVISIALALWTLVIVVLFTLKQAANQPGMTDILSFQIGGDGVGFTVFSLLIFIVILFGFFWPRSGYRGNMNELLVEAENVLKEKFPGAKVKILSDKDTLMPTIYAPKKLHKSMHAWVSPLYKGAKSLYIGYKPIDAFEEDEEEHKQDSLETVTLGLSRRIILVIGALLVLFLAGRSVYSEYKGGVEERLITQEQEEREAKYKQEAEERRAKAAKFILPNGYKAKDSIRVTKFIEKLKSVKEVRVTHGGVTITVPFDYEKQDMRYSYFKGGKDPFIQLLGAFYIRGAQVDIAYNYPEDKVYLYFPRECWDQKFCDRYREWNKGNSTRNPYVLVPSTHSKFLVWKSAGYEKRNSGYDFRLVSY